MEGAKRFPGAAWSARLMTGWAVGMLLTACAATPPAPVPVQPAVVAAPPPAVAPPPPPPRDSLPEAFESKDFVLAIARADDTVESLAARYLGTRALAWMITDYGARSPLSAGQRVAIPRRQWNPAGVTPSGFQVVPVRAYATVPASGRRGAAAGAPRFAAQMRHLKSAGYHPVRLSDFIAFLQHRRQLPQKSVLITFDDVQRDFLTTAYPVLRELGFPAVVFVSTAAVSSRPGGPALTWNELRDLARSGIDAQAQSRLRDLRRGGGEGVDAYSRRMQQELEPPVELLRKQLPRLPDGLETLAYSGGGWTDEVIRYARQYGYGAAFGLSGEPNPAFVGMFKISRTPIPLDAPLEDFKRALVAFYEQPIGPSRPEVGPHWSQPIDLDASRRDVAAPHREWSAVLERRGLLREARDECLMAAAIDADDVPAAARCADLGERIAGEEARLVKEGVALSRAGNPAARGPLLAALALNPASSAAFEALQSAPAAGRFLRHIVGPRDTAVSLADLYYGDRKRAELIEQANGLAPGASLTPGQMLRIPEIQGVPFLRPDR
jgi:peptidoglycan/xylan/chitin deacetylase (PgdA/CDA1 family)